MTEDRNALNFASRRQRRDVDVVVASLLGASKRETKAHVPNHDHHHQQHYDSNQSTNLSPSSLHKSSHYDYVASASEVQV